MKIKTLHELDVMKSRHETERNELLTKIFREAGLFDVEWQCESDRADGFILSETVRDNGLRDLVRAICKEFNDCYKVTLDTLQGMRIEVHGGNYLGSDNGELQIHLIHPSEEGLRAAKKKYEFKLAECRDFDCEIYKLQSEINLLKATKKIFSIE